MNSNFTIGETLWHKSREQYCLYLGTKGCGNGKCIVQFLDEKIELVNVNELETT